MPIPQGRVLFPGVEQPVSCTYSLSHGISPGIAHLVVKPQTHFEAEGGDLSFVYEDVTIVIKDCKVIDHKFHAPDRGVQTWSLSVADRRWKWAFGGPSGPLFGHYNLRRPDGSLDTRLEKTPRELAALCLDAMGETGYNVQDLPNDQRPLVEWDAEIPAQALQDMCEHLGCRIVFQLDNTVAIRVTGVGQEIFIDNGTIDASGTIDPPERPDSIQCWCGPTRFQIQCPLEAVGMEKGPGTDANRTKRINNLSYKPAAGWGTWDVNFSTVLQEYDIDSQALAIKTIFKWYRLYCTNLDGSTPLKVVYEFDKVFTMFADPYRTLEAIVPVEDIWPAITKNSDGSYSTAPPLIWGTWYDGTHLGIDGFTNRTTVDNGDGTFTYAFYRKPYRVNRELGVIEFESQLFKMTNPPAVCTQLPADLYIQIAASVRNKDQWNWYRYYREKLSPDGNRWLTGPEIIHRDEMILSVWDTKQKANGDPSGRKDPADPRNGYGDTVDEIKPMLDFYLDAADQKYQVKDPEQAAYTGIRAINPDGAIHQIVFHITERGTTTQVSRNNELIPISLTFQERRFLEKMRSKQLHQAIRHSTSAMKRKLRPGEVAKGVI